MPSRYFITTADQIPIGLGVVLPRGAMVNSTQPNTNNIAVHEGHEFLPGHKFLYAQNRTNILTARVFTVELGGGIDHVVFTGSPFTFPDKSLLVNLGADSGGVLQGDGSFTRPEYNGSTVAVYQDPNGDAAVQFSRVPSDTGGELGFWGDGAPVWILGLDTGFRPVRLYPDVGPGGAGGSVGLTTIESLSSEPDPVGYEPSFYQLYTGVGPGVIKIKVTGSDGNDYWEAFIEGRTI